MSYEKLFEKGRIGTLVLKNRGVMMPMATDMADKDGIVTPRQIRYLSGAGQGRHRHDHQRIHRRG